MAPEFPRERVSPFKATRRLNALPEPTDEVVAYWLQRMALVASSQDQGSFMEIYDHFAPRVLRFLLGRGVARSQAEELVQESMLRLWRNANQYDAQRATLSTWLFRIARNLHVDSLRGQGSWQPVDDGMELLESESHAPTGEGPDAYTDHLRLNRTINALPADQARLIRMSYLESKSHREIADELGMALGTVKSTLRRTFEKLKAALRSSP